MSKLFNPDNGLMQALSRIWDFMSVSILWLICCIPIVTIGPATAALYYVTGKMITNTDDGIVKPFFRSFFRNLRQGIVLTLILAAIALLLWWNYRIFSAQATQAATVVCLFIRILSIYFLAGMLFVFPLLAQFDNKLFTTLRNAFVLPFAYLPRTIGILVIHAIPFVIYLFTPDFFYKTLPIWLIFAPAAVSYCASMLFYKIFNGKPLFPPRKK